MINAATLVNSFVSSDIRFAGCTHDDHNRLMQITSEAFCYLQRFKKRQLVWSESDVTDPATQEVLGELEKRAICLYVQIHFDGDSELQDGLAYMIEMVRDR